MTVRTEEGTTNACQEAQAGEIIGNPTTASADPIARTIPPDASAASLSGAVNHVRCLHARVNGGAHLVATAQLTSLAKTADLFVFAWKGSSHQTFYCVKDALAGKEPIWAPGKGAASIWRAVLDHLEYPDTPRRRCAGIRRLLIDAMNRCVMRGGRQAVCQSERRAELLNKKFC